MSQAERFKVVAVAESQVGVQDPSRYWEEVLAEHDRGKGFTGEWCGGFALWCLHSAGLGFGIHWQIGKGFCFRLPVTHYPEPGDVGYIHAPYQHHAVIVSVDGPLITSVDGNQKGSTVQRKTRDRSAFTFFYSIAPLLTASETST